MKAFKLQVTSSVKLKIDWIHIMIKVPQNLQSKLTGLYFSKTFLSWLIWANMPVRRGTHLRFNAIKMLREISLALLTQVET